MLRLLETCQLPFYYAKLVAVGKRNLNTRFICHESLGLRLRELHKRYSGGNGNRGEIGFAYFSKTLTMTAK